MKSGFAFFAIIFCLTYSLFASPQLEKSIQFSVKGNPSQRNLLHRTLQPVSLQKEQADTLRILAIRVEFRPDTLKETNGTGKFILQPPAEPTIDPGPHNRAYFDAQLQALAHYFATVSRGRLILAWDIYPLENNSAYQLSHEMIYYAPGKDSAASDERLAELFRDGFEIADQQDQIDFSKYQSFILFHAGVGSDLNFDFDPTPNDVPSAFLNFQDLQKNLAPGDANFQGIPVQNGQYFIQDGIVLPETESQEGFEIGLLGTAAIMMGFQIGLPSLFNPDNGASGIGRWGLMDQGSGNFQGLLPAEPSAWEKVFMGWERPIVIQTGKDFKVAAPRVTITPNHIYKIPINANEYFLLENRQRDVNGDQIAVGRDNQGNRVEFKDPGQILSDTPIGVITSVDEYDFGLPGSGILIWHIDESVIRARLSENRINSDRDHRGVDLEEADGAQDIGRFYGFLHPGSGAENGVPEDAWHQDNPINKLVNKSEVVRFGPNTMPSTRSYSGANSHVVITDFSKNSGLMSFSVLNDRLVSGFPQLIGTHPLPPMAAELDPAVPGKEIVLARKDGAILAFYGNGTALGTLADSLSFTAPGKEIRKVVQQILLKTNDTLDIPPAFADLDNDGTDEMILATANGTLAVYSFHKTGKRVRPELQWQIAATPKSSGPVAISPLQENSTIFWGSGKILKSFTATGQSRFSVALSSNITKLAIAGSVVVVQAGQEIALIRDGNEFPEWVKHYPDTVANVAIADLDNDGALDLIVQEASDRIHIVRLDGTQKTAFQVYDNLQKTGLAVGDVDGDGLKDIVLGHASGIYATNLTGSMLASFPVWFPSEEDHNQDAFWNEPVLMDANGDQQQEIFLIARAGDLYGVNAKGRILPDFPIAFAASPEQSLAAADINGDGELELIAVSGSGFLSVFKLPGTLSSYSHNWTAWGANPQQTRANLHKETPKQNGGQLLPANLAYNYPNPTEGNSTTIRYRLNGPAQVKIKILDLAGELVDEFPGPAVPFVDNEVKWPLNHIQSGVYLARVEAKGEGKSDVVVFKIAVVK